ncbi:MAG: DUF1330 domain-containing protein [Candidatus Binataceae bacterium]|nr:DUF1330 domain-containing protein [Candidatus Binataceae bacterium]
MSVYLVAVVDVHDPQEFRSYVTDVPPIVAKFGGRYLVRGGELEVVEGQWPVPRVTVVEFPTMEQAKGWWNSEEYRPYRELRGRTARTNAVMVQGLAE